MSDDPQKPAPLAYSSEEPKRARAGVGLVFGALFGVIVMFFLGIAVFDIKGGREFTPHRSMPAALICAGAGLIAAWMARRCIRAPRRSWFFLGFSIATMVMALIEGLCFAGGST